MAVHFAVDWEGDQCAFGDGGKCGGCRGWGLMKRAEVDRLVYDLYGFAEDEIRGVEKSLSE